MRSHTTGTSATIPHQKARDVSQVQQDNRRAIRSSNTGLQKRADASPYVSHLNTLQAHADSSVRFVPDQNAVTQRQSFKSTSPAKVLQRDRVSAKLGDETVSADRSGDAETLAFLEPRRAKGRKYAPVHLTKKVKMAGANLIHGGGVTHDGLNAQKAAAPDYHFTITSGFMTAALMNSHIKRYLVKHGRAAEIWKFEDVDVAGLAQNKLKANEIVAAFNSDLGLAQAANFDNLMLTYDPGGQGPTFDAVVAFHEGVKNTLFSVPSVNPGSDVPFKSIHFSKMRSVITAGADNLAAQWSNWTDDGPAATRNDFRISADKWTDLAKAVNILNRIRAKALKLETPGAAAGVAFDDAFIDANLTAHANAKTAIKANMHTDQATHAAEFT